MMDPSGSTVRDRLKGQIQTLYDRLQTVRAGTPEAQRLIVAIRALARLYYAAEKPDADREPRS